MHYAIAENVIICGSTMPNRDIQEKLAHLAWPRIAKKCTTERFMAHSTSSRQEQVVEDDKTMA